MLESWFWGSALVALIGTAALVAVAACRQPPVVREGDATARVPDPRRVFGRKRRWRRDLGLARRLGFLPQR